MIGRFLLPMNTGRQDSKGAFLLQVGYCGLDRKPFGGGDADGLDIMTYCDGYIAWDLMSLFIQASLCSLMA